MSAHPTDRAAPAALADLLREGHPDAALLRACADYRRSRAAFDADGRDDDVNPHYAPMLAALDLISATRPRTMAGARAKAQAARVTAQRIDGTTDYGATLAARLAGDVVEALVRLTGGAA